MLTLKPAGLSEDLAARLNAVERLGGMTADGRHKVPQRSIEGVVCEARKALETRNPRVIETALKSIELLSLELCDD